MGSAVVTTAVFGVPPKTPPSSWPALIGVGGANVNLAGETPARATGTVALPNPSESFRFRASGGRRPERQRVSGKAKGQSYNYDIFGFDEVDGLLQIAGKAKGSVL